jgi:hypothetical protein
MEALAETNDHTLNIHEGFIKLCKLLGLFKPVRGRKKIYSGHLRKALQRLTSSANNIPSLPADSKDGETNTPQNMENIQTGNPGEAGHTGAGIKPGGRYDYM